MRSFIARLTKTQYRTEFGWSLKSERKPGKFGKLFYCGNKKFRRGGGSIRICPDCYGNLLDLCSWSPYKKKSVTTSGNSVEKPSNGTGSRSYWYGSCTTTLILLSCSRRYGYIRKCSPCAFKCSYITIHQTDIPTTILTWAKNHSCGSPGTNPETLHNYKLHTQKQCNARHT